MAVFTYAAIVTVTAGIPKKGSLDMAARSKPEAEETSKVLDTVPAYSDTDLLAINTFEDALNLARELYGDENLVTADQVLGNGFRLLKDKVQLIGKAFIALSWRFNPGDFGEFVSMLIVTEDGGKYIVNDGSTGVCQTLASYTNATGRHGGMVARNGLTVSNYEYEDEKGEKHPASTYYIDTSA
jgi:hypothetical protein